VLEDENENIDEDLEDEINSKPASEAIDSFRSKEDSFVEEEIEQEMPIEENDKKIKGAVPNKIKVENVDLSIKKTTAVQKSPAKQETSVLKTQSIVNKNAVSPIKKSSDKSFKEQPLSESDRSDVEFGNQESTVLVSPRKEVGVAKDGKEIISCQIKAKVEKEEIKEDPKEEDKGERMEVE
jgi:hypothetical protein